MTDAQARSVVAAVGILLSAALAALIWGDAAID